MFSFFNLASVIGQTITGRYRVIKELGKGGFGQTYLAEALILPNNQQSKYYGDRYVINFA